MKYISVCSGIEAATVAWHTLGWEAFAYSEIEAFPSAVLAHHYPNTPNFGDMTKFQEWPDAAINVLVGGTPCQSFSVAGLRKGLADPRGNLMLTYLAIAAKYRPKWVVWENVPGVLSSNGGRDFASLLRGLAELGYGFAYRVLDAQYFGVPQRRRRVFVVGCLGSWQSAAAVLFERHSLSGHPAPSRQAGQEVTPTIRAGAANGGAGHGARSGDSKDELIVPVAGTIKASIGRSRGAGISPATLCVATGQAGAEIGADMAPTLNCNHEAPYIAHAFKVRGGCEGGGKGYLGSDDKTFTITANDDQMLAVAAFKGGQGSAAGGIGYDQHVSPTLSAADSGSNRTPALMQGMQVRRLTPRECERLQGFSDNYTLIPYRNKPAADGPRYKALGNSMCVNVMAWIGERIAAVESISRIEAAA